MTAALFIDTAMNSCGVALCDGAGEVYAVHRHIERGQAETLMPMVEELLGKAHMHAKDLNAIAVTIGPGTFTGLRVGMAAALGMSIAHNTPMFSGITLDLLAHQNSASLSLQEKPSIGADDLIMSVVETKREDFYVAFYTRQGQLIGKHMALKAPALIDHITKLTQGTDHPIHIYVHGDAQERFCSAVHTAILGDRRLDSGNLKDNQLTSEGSIVINDVITLDVSSAPQNIDPRAALAAFKSQVKQRALTDIGASKWKKNAQTQTQQQPQTSAHPQGHAYTLNLFTRSDNPAPLYLRDADVSQPKIKRVIEGA